MASMIKFQLQVFCIILVVNIGLSEGQDVPISSVPCNAQFTCSPNEQVTWTSDGISCLVFRNECHLANENCYRHNRGERVLAEVSKGECQKKCRDICPAVYSPVCAAYNGVRRTFSNFCILESHICRTGETYEFTIKGSCPI